MTFQKVPAHAIGAGATHPETATSIGELVKARLVAVGFAVIMIFTVGFVTTPSIHNFAHDTRHSQAFPCH